MSANLKGRSFLTDLDLNREEYLQLLDDAIKLKNETKTGIDHPILKGKILALIFQKPSLRTRTSFEVGMIQLGGSAIYIGPDEIGIGKRETTEDIAKVLSRYVDGIMARVFGHDIVEDFAKYGSVPVINGLSDYTHPCQALADLMTVKEKLGRTSDFKLTYVGDGNNVANSLAFSAAILGYDFRIASPKGYEISEEVVDFAREKIKENGQGSVELFESPEKAAEGTNVLYADVWASMGQEAEAEKRRKDLAAYQINMNLVKKADPNCIILHCMPAHYGEEITKEAAYSEHSAMFDQAENRLHAQKALMVAVMK
jgi:ornithine carbamoyltransferase